MDRTTKAAITIFGIVLLLLLMLAASAVPGTARRPDC
jgi:hypothetical protein